MIRGRYMNVKVYIACAVFISISLIAASCAVSISQEEYDRLGSELAQTEDELALAKAVNSDIEDELMEIQKELDNAQAELDSIKASPPALEIDFIDAGKIAKLINLKVSKDNPQTGTYIIECQLELTGALPGPTNVVDVELYINDRFVDSDRWIDISSTGFLVTKAQSRLDTGMEDLVESIKLKIVPSFKVFGA
jgi:hypothetical protein